MEEEVVDGMRGGEWVNRTQDHTERTQTTWTSTQKTTASSPPPPTTDKGPPQPDQEGPAVQQT